MGDGSSPLARGLLVLAERVIFPPGIIPARAGFTATCAAAWRPAADHPRSRGVYPPGEDHRDHSRGIIPARAGFTARPAPPDLENGDHPRSRGVYRRGRTIRILTTGSSPLARGLRNPPILIAEVGRIIPARAGFTLTTAIPNTFTEDHPRSRGVYRDLPHRGDLELRIIPARAGFTRRPPYDRCRRSGSSPLARGLQHNAILLHDRRRIIPARAGFTIRHIASTSTCKDHPRSRGVY